jgi:sec-independent protein translocase protein TatA
MGWDAPWHWIVLAIVVIALFGYKRLPDAARSLGRSLRIFKTEMKGMGEDDKKRAAKAAPEEPKAIENPATRSAETAAAPPTEARPSESAARAETGGSAAE